MPNSGRDELPIGNLAQMISRNRRNLADEPTRNVRKLDDRLAKYRRKSDERPARNRHSSDERPARNRHNSDERPARNRHNSDERPARNRHSSDEIPTRTRRHSDERPTRNRRNSDDRPARNRPNSDDRPTRNRPNSDDRLARNSRSSDEKPRRKRGGRELDDIRATRAKIAELTKSMKTQRDDSKSRPYRHTQKSLSANSRSVKLDPLGPRRSPNELDKKQKRDPFKSKSSPEATNEMVPQNQTEEKLMDQWRRTRKMGLEEGAPHGPMPYDDYFDPHDYDPHDFDPHDFDPHDFEGRKSDWKKEESDPEVDAQSPERSDNEDKGYKRPSERYMSHPEHSDGIKDQTRYKEEEVTIRTIKEIIRQINGMLEEDRLLGVFRARRHLSMETNPPIQMYIDEGVLPPLVSCLSSHNPNVQFEAVWAVTNICAGNSDQAMAVYEAGAVPELITLLNSPYNRVSDQCVWAIANLATDGPFFWQSIVDEGAVKPLYLLIERSHSVASLRNLSWAFSNILRRKPLTLSDSDFSLCLKAVRLFLHHPDKEIQLNACWSLVYITDNEPGKIEDLITAGIIPRLVEEVHDNRDGKAVLPAIRALGNIMTGNDDTTQKILNSRVISALVKHLDNASTAVQKDATWALSNVTAGPQSQIQAVLDAKALPKLSQIIQKKDPSLRKEAAWCVSNMIQAASKDQLKKIVDANLVQELTRVVARDEDDESLLVVAFEGLTKMAEKCNDKRVIEQILAELSFADIAKFTKHENKLISKYTTDLCDIIADSFSGE